MASSVLLLLCLCLFPASTGIYCSLCGKEIQPGKYIKSGADSFCSDKCFKEWVSKKLPHCAVCGRPVENGYTKDGKVYCSMDCLSSTFPTCFVCGRHSAKGVLLNGDPAKFICAACNAKTKCDVCGLPNASQSLQDGRHVCQTCFKSGVFDYAKALTLFNSVRAVLRDRLGIATNSPIKMELVGVKRLELLSGKKSNSGQEMGLFEYSATLETTYSDATGKYVENTERKDEQWRIYALFGLPPDRLEEVFAHELAHDWMQRFCPAVRDSKIREGWAEYIAWRYNALFGRTEFNRRIESNPDPVYGDGFRLIKGIADREGFDGLKRLLRKGGPIL